MKKYLALLLALAITVVMFAGCGSSSEEPAADESAESKYAAGYVFKHGFDQDYRPYSFIGDDGKSAGFDVEMAQAVAEFYGWEYEAVPFNWDAKDAELNAGSCDCIWSGFTLNGRENDYLWSEPYSNNTQVIMTLADSGITALSDLADKKVGVQTATSAYDLLNDEEGQKALRDTFADLVVYENYTIAINDLKAGAVDALAIDITRAKEATEKEDGFYLLEEELGSEVYAIGFRKGDEELCDLINIALQALSQDGTVDKIAANYPEIQEYLTIGTGASK